MPTPSCRRCSPRYARARRRHSRRPRRPSGGPSAISGRREDSMTQTTPPGDRVEIVLLGAQRPEALAELERRFTVHRTYEAPDPLAALRELGPRVRGAASHGMAGLSRAQIEALPKLEICAINGVGLETTDLAAARERGITVTIAPVLYDDVADLALALALAACRRIVEGVRCVRSSLWLWARMALASKLTVMRADILVIVRI